MGRLPVAMRRIEATTVEKGTEFSMFRNTHVQAAVFELEVSHRARNEISNRLG